MWFINKRIGRLNNGLDIRSLNWFLGKLSQLSNVNPFHSKDINEKKHHVTIRKIPWVHDASIWTFNNIVIDDFFCYLLCSCVLPSALLSVCFISQLLMLQIHFRRKIFPIVKQGMGNSPDNLRSFFEENRKQDALSTIARHTYSRVYFENCIVFFLVKHPAFPSS